MPYAFGQTNFVVGASYEVGFNNTVALAWELVFTVLAALALARSGWVTAPPRDQARPLVESIQARVAVASLVIAHVALFAMVAAMRGRFVFGESLYFQTRLFRMSQGEVPFLDFAYYYGPTMIYPGAWLSSILGLDAGYAVWFILTYAFGLVLLFLVLRALLHSEVIAAVAFGIIAIAFFNPWAGLNVTFVRFVLPLAVFLLASSVVRRADRASIALLIALACVALLYSFDVAASAALAIVLAAVCAAIDGDARVRGLARRALGLHAEGPMRQGSAFDAWPIRRGAAALATAAVIAVVLLVLLDATGSALREYPGAALSYASGAYNQPIHPHLPFLAIAAFSVFAVAGAVRSAARGEGAIAIGLAVLALAAHRGAFAVADPSHFAYYGLPALIVSMALAGRRRSIAIILSLAVIGLGLPLQFYQASQFFPSAFRTTSATVPQTSSSVAAGKPLELALERLAMRLGADRPYLMFDVEYNSLPVFRRLGIRYAAYATDFSTITSFEALERLLGDLRSSDAVILMPKQRLLEAPPEPEIDPWLDAAAGVTGAQVPGSRLRALLIRNSWRVQDGFLDAVRAEWIVVDEQDGIVAMRRPQS